jgi:tRNA threonylcarbamoyladenosine biosynthesis protein TsaE
LGETLRGGEIIELCGPLGAGKTEVAKGLALGLGVRDDEPVVSPTFVLVREYAGRLTLHHCDAYRLQTAQELLMLGVEEILDDPGAVVALEWADRFPGALAADTIRIDLQHENDWCRRIRISTPSEACTAELARRLADSGFAVAGAR